jgi:hypothetical protein
MLLYLRATNGVRVPPERGSEGRRRIDNIFDYCNSSLYYINNAPVRMLHSRRRFALNGE